MFGEVTTEIKAQLYERVRSPLIGAFGVAWVAWNFRAILVLFSTVSVEEKLLVWQVMYPGTWEAFPQAVGYPVLTAALFLLAYPYPARWAYHYWHWQHKKLKQIQQQIDDETPMTQEEAKELRRTSLEQQAQMQAQLRSLADVNRELANQREALLTQIAEIQKKANEQIESLTRQLDQANLSLSKQSKRSEENASSAEKVEARPSKEEAKTKAQLSKVPPKALEVLQKLVAEHNLSSQQAMVFFALVQNGGRLSKESLYGAMPGVNRIEVDHGVDTLGSIGFSHDAGSAVVLTDTGRRIAVQAGLTKAVER